MANATRTRSPLRTWIILAVVGIVILLFAGLLPLPGQKDNVTPHSQPSEPGTSPQAELPKGPPSTAAGPGTQPLPGGMPESSPGNATTAASK